MVLCEAMAARYRFRFFIASLSVAPLLHPGSPLAHPSTTPPQTKSKFRANEDGDYF